ncbi:creatinine amidohydrolase [Xaviernesmea oryzae]|uniref:Creatinine amidohydrolase n=1 Tax=Xaviernesmea oryzae TaxID=464029 RepID=A0A1X7GMZ9_9HYPH|nr:creatininase family protein [Xaviernesmea oryzae]SMF72214.1 creatinine amidohydrolase [Xaviernesmea oryzae]
MMTATRKHALKDMTFAEFRERLSEKPVILLPFGSQEEQGPHAPMGDFMLTEAVAAKVAEAADAIVAPTIPFGWADFFRTIPGGIQFRPSTFSAVVEDTVTAFLDHGIEHILVLNGHTSNASLFDQTLRRIRAERGVSVPFINLWQSIPDALWKELHGPSVAAARGHGGDPLTSIYLHLFPELMRMDLARPSVRAKTFGLPTGGVNNVQFEGMPVHVPLDCHEVNADGMLGGDPSLASAEKGAKMVEHLVGFCARFVEHMRRCDMRSVTAFTPEETRAIS